MTPADLSAWALGLCFESVGDWLLLMRVSGVPMLERSIHERRPEYAAYVERTSAFLPRRPKPTRRADQNAAFQPFSSKACRVQWRDAGT